MSKRKREEYEDDGIENAEQLRSQGRFKARFGSGVNELTAALKLARGFERQKMGRRQKQAATEPHTLLRLREEVIILKKLELEKTARNYLLKCLSKIKRIRESSIFISALGAELNKQTVQAGAEANVLGRLFKTAPVKEAVDKIIDATYKNLALKPGASKDPNAKEGTRIRKEAHNSNSSLLQNKIQPLDLDAERVASADGDMEIGSDDGRVDDFASFISEEITSSSSVTSDNKQATLETFLPTLGMAGYYSGSDSEQSEVESVEPNERKNRRGQRARQHIAELKYGRNAKHLQGHAGKVQTTKWDPRKGAVSGGQAQRGKYNEKRSNSNRSGANNTEVVIRKPKPAVRDDAGALHPSWQAAKLRKEQSAGQNAFAGNKVTFD